MDAQREIIIPRHYPVQRYKNKEKDYISLLLLLYLFQTGTREEAISGFQYIYTPLNYMYMDSSLEHKIFFLYKQLC